METYKNLRHLSIRWIGAYGNRASVRQCSKYESNPGKTVAAQACFSKQDLRTIKSSIGLIIDEANTTLVRGFPHDVYSDYNKNGRLFAGRLMSKYNIKKWENIHILDNRRFKKWHTEIWIRNPKYMAIIVDTKYASRNNYRYARRLSKAMGIPLVRYSDVSFSRQRRYRPFKRIKPAIQKQGVLKVGTTFKVRKISRSCPYYCYYNQSVGTVVERKIQQYGDRDVEYVEVSGRHNFGRRYTVLFGIPSNEEVIVQLRRKEILFIMKDRRVSVPRGNQYDINKNTGTHYADEED